MQMKCPSCAAAVTLRPEDSNCPQCGHRLREGIEEMNARIALEQAAHSIRRARMWLLIATGLGAAVAGFLYLAVANQWSSLPPQVKLSIYGAAGMAGVFFALWAWAARQPLPATLIALVLYGGATLVATVANPGAALGSPLGLTLRLFVIAALTSGVIAAVKHRRLSRTGAHAG